MFYVYLLESIHHAGERYVGVTHDLKLRLTQHNAGESPQHRRMQALAAGDLYCVLG